MQQTLTFRLPLYKFVTQPSEKYQKFIKSSVQDTPISLQAEGGAGSSENLLAFPRLFTKSMLLITARQANCCKRKKKEKEIDTSVRWGFVGSGHKLFHYSWVGYSSWNNRWSLVWVLIVLSNWELYLSPGMNIPLNSVALGQKRAHNCSLP